MGKTKALLEVCKMAGTEDIKRKSIGFLTWQETRGDKEVVLVKIEGPCPQCGDRITTGDIVVGYFEPATGKGYVRKTAELLGITPKLTCRACNFLITLPIGAVEALTIAGEASIKIERALRTLSRFSPN